MKRFTKKVSAMIFLAPMMACAATNADKPDPTFGAQLSDCSAFFGLLSQSNSEFSAGMKGFSLASTSYAIVAFSDPGKFEIETGKSMVRLVDEFPNLKQDKTAFENKFTTCVSVLKTAELELRPLMDETTKQLVPEMFLDK
jgi:hypothetical protein